MARQSGFTVQNKPIKGLITEQTALSFGDDACTEIWDCQLDDKGRVSRRKAWQLEEDNTDTEVAEQADGNYFTEFRWENAGGDSEKRLVVQQIGNLVYFFDASESDSISEVPPLPQTLSLSDYLAPNMDPLTAMPGQHGCQFTSGNNDLIIVNAHCNPIAVTYDTITETLTFREIIVEIRDFEGLSDGFDDTFRPTSDVTSIKTSNPNFFYNLINNGWGQTDALTQWDAARTDLPSKADHPSFYRASATDSFDPAQVTAKSPGNRLGTGGHFIFPLNDPDRAQALIDEGYTGVLPIDPLDAPIPQVLGTTFGNGVVAFPPANGFDGVPLTTYTRVQNPTTFLGLGKDYGGDPKAILKVKVYPYRFDAYRYLFCDSVNHSGVNPLRIEVYGHSSAPNATYDNGTLLATHDFDEVNNPTLPFTNYPDGIEINSSDTITTFQYVWVKLMRQSGLALSPDLFAISEMYIYDNDATVQKEITCDAVAFYAGRIFYGFNNQVVFSQIVESNEQYGRCYQNNDPTNEEISDLLPSDGGVIQIRDMGKIDKMFPAFQSLLIFARNGVWRVSGSSNGPFKADDYAVERISNYGQEAPQSYVNVRGVPAWWSYEGIQTINYDPQYGSFAIKSLSQETIESFVRDIPASNKKYVKAAYDIRKKIVHWLYSDDEDFDHLDPVYNKVLCMNTNTGAFYPWTIPTSDYEICGIVSLNSLLEDNRDAIRYTTKYPSVNVGFYNVSYAEPVGTTYYDWEPELGEDDRIDYLSYFITGYKIDGQGMRDVQVNYCTVFMEREEGSSVYMQCVYDFTVNGNTGRWSVPQQCYGVTPASISMRKLKLRGRGKAIQFRFKSESGKPFKIIGWANWETGNSGV